MRIKDYIKELLFTNQGVIIPDLGGFVSEYEPAAFDVTENKFLPPSKKITFNSDYKFQDSLLIDFISEKENISKEESTKAVINFVKEIKSGIDNNDKIDFPEIGILSKSIKGTIQFKQSKDSNLLTNSFGLQSIKTKPIENPKIEAKKPIEVKTKKSYKKQIIIISSAAVFLSLIGLGWYLTNGFSEFNFMASNDIKNNVVNEIVELNNSQKYLDSIAKADSIKAIINESIDENTDIKDALFYKEPEVKPIKLQYSEFHIVAGSFKRIENAEKFSEELKNKGYNPKIVQSADTLYRIAISSFTEETEALKELYKLRQKADIKSVWILKVI